MAGLFDDQSLTLPCPADCGYEFRETVGRLARNPKRTCPRCGQKLHFDVEDIRRAEKKIVNMLNKAIEDVNRELRKLR